MGASVLQFSSKVLKLNLNAGTPPLEWVPTALKDHNTDILVRNELPKY